MDIKDFKSLIPNSIWSFLRQRKIVHHHAQVAKVCEKLIEQYYQSDIHEELPIRPRKELPSNKIIWQYWAQGFENLPKVVQECMDSVDRWKGDYLVIRLQDSTIDEYLELPEWLEKKKEIMSKAHFSDILRLCLLTVYGGVWLDATIKLSGFFPERFREMPFFVFQRDLNEKNKSYWENTYAYYFGWNPGFRVNMLNSVFFAKKESEVVKVLCQLMFQYWENATTIPDYFFFQILFDVLINGRLKNRSCPIESDCLPHYLQQSINDPRFNLATQEEILKNILIHKLTYK